MILTTGTRWWQSACWFPLASHLLGRREEGAEAGLQRILWSLEWHSQRKARKTGWIQEQRREPQRWLHCFTVPHLPLFFHSFETLLVVVMQVLSLPFGYQLLSLGLDLDRFSHIIKSRWSNVKQQSLGVGQVFVKVVVYCLISYSSISTAMGKILVV